jgi:hypothetical protein
MEANQFRDLVKLVEPVFYHNLDSRHVICEHFRDVMAYFDVPVEWHEPVRVMAEGWSYYGADIWMQASEVTTARELLKRLCQ